MRGAPVRVSDQLHPLHTGASDSRARSAVKADLGHHRSREQERTQKVGPGNRSALKIEAPLQSRPWDSSSSPGIRVRG